MKSLKKLFLLSMVFLLVLQSFGSKELNRASALVLNAPANFKAEVFQYYNKLSWTENNTSYYYTVIEKSIDQGAYNPIATLYKGTTTYSDYSISNGHVYAYRAKTYYGSDSSAYTSEAEAITLYPATFNITRALHNQVDLEWTYPTLSLQRAAHYETLIERRLSNTSTWTLIATLPDSETSFRDTAVDSDSYYYYRIRTRYTNGSYSYYFPSDWGISTRTAYPLTTPLWGYAVSDNQIKLEWDMSKVNGGTAIIQKRDAAGNFSTIFSSSYANSTIDSGLTKGTTYTYRLVLQSKNGMYSDFTEEIKVISESVPSPKDLSVSALSTDRVIISWSYPYEVETGFELWRKSSDSWTLLATLPKNTENFTDTGAESGQSHSYMVRAKRGETAYSSFSLPESVINEFPQTPKPLVYWTTPGMLHIYSAEETAPNTTITLEYRRDINSEWMDFKSCSEGTLFAYVSYSNYSEFYFRLRANKGDLVSIGPEYHFFGSAPEPAQNLKAPLIGYKRLLLTWDDVSQKEEGYNIYRTVGGRRELIGSVAGNADSFTDNSPVKGSVSRYEVMAYNVSGESVAKTLTVTVPNIVAYKDIPLSSWAHDAVYTLQGLGALENVQNGIFNPQIAVTRGQAVRMILRSFNIPCQPQGLFTVSDLSPKHAYYQDLMTAVALGISFPDTQGRMYPDKAVTRGELIQFLNNALNYWGKPLSPHDTEELKQYGDFHQVSSEEAPIIASFIGDGIIAGKSGSMLGLSSNASKAESVVIIYRTLMRYGLN